MKDYDLLAHPVSIVLTAVQTNSIFQTIGFILTILSVCLSIAYTVYKWWHKAHADGKITPEEIEELKDDIKEHLDE